MTILLDCTFRDGGYYNNWDFNLDVANSYLYAVKLAGVDIAEVGFRTIKNNSFKGAFAYSTDDFLVNLDIPNGLMIGVMLNASDLLAETSIEFALNKLFPNSKNNSPINLVRIACHSHEFAKTLPAAIWLKERGYSVGFNLMQIADKPKSDICELAEEAKKYPIDVLYFADSMGSMLPNDVSKIVEWLRGVWELPLGIHTHDNMGMALQNSLRALDEGVMWVDSTVTGMGRGPGNAKTEELAIEMQLRRESRDVNLVPLITLVNKVFKPQQIKCGWGTNPYYYLSGKYGIHPTFIQEMIGDSRYDESEIFSVIEYLKNNSGTKFNSDTLEVARMFFSDGNKNGSWNSGDVFQNREVLLLGGGQGIFDHALSIESYIKKNHPIVVALNTQASLSEDLIDLRIASHPIRLLSDASDYLELPQPLITPFSSLPDSIKQALKGKKIFDFGMKITPGIFNYENFSCSIPNHLVLSYALGVINSGGAKNILLAGFDGYGPDDPRTNEINNIFNNYLQASNSIPLTSVTPTRYLIPVKSIYGM